MAEERIEKIADDIISIDPRLSLAQLYGGLGGYELFVEPLSLRQPIGNWLLEGGIGYNSLREGTLGATVLGFTSSYKGEPFEYGLEYTALYSVGYPLHRILEASSLLGYRSREAGEGETLPPILGDSDLGPIKRLTLPIREKQKWRISVEDIGVSEASPPLEATNAVFLNAFGAKVMGLRTESFLVTYPEWYGEGEELEEIWGRRFVVDSLPEDHAILKVFTMRSTLPQIYEKHGKAKGLFLALFTNKGVLVVISGKEEKLNAIWSDLEGSKFTYKVG